MRIVPDRTTAVIIDLQERLLPHMHEHQTVLSRSTLLIRGLKLLEIPMILTEQYPAGLGETVNEIWGLSVADHPIEKVTFSCCDEPSVIAQLKESGRGTVLLAGIETHVCVLQTALDLKDSGYEPVIVADAVASRRENDKEIALQRLVHEGCRITTVESILFELLRTSRHTVFKEISKLIK